MRTLVFSAVLLAAVCRGQTGDLVITEGACGDGVACTPSPPFKIRAFFNQMEIGSLTGVSYQDGQYLLYATTPEPGKRPVILYRDTLVQLGRVVLATSDDSSGGMSLDFVPSGRKKFDADDILDVREFAHVLASGRRLAAALRASPGGKDVLKQCMALRDDQKPSKALRDRIADLLNQARSRSDIESLVGSEDLLPETQVFLKTVRDPSRRSRIKIEDFFRGAIDKDVEDKYHVVFKASSPELQERMKPLLINSRASAIWTAADTRLKMMVAGKEGLDYRIGPSQQILCAEEARSQLARDVDLNVGQFVDYMRLNVQYADMGGVGVWFRHPVLEVLADRVTGKETPGCAMEWSARLSKRMPWILQQDDPVADDLRALLQILILHRAVAFFWQTAPMSADRLDLLQRDAEDLPSIPPKVVKSEIAIGARGEIHVLRTVGGVDWGGKNPAPHPSKVASPSRLDNSPLRDNGAFLVTDLPDGQILIDVSSILAP